MTKATMTDLTSALRTNFLLLVVTSGYAVATCLIAFALFALLSSATGRARARMARQQYAIDSDDYLRVTRAFGWFATFRDIAGWLIVIIISVDLLPVIPGMSIALPAALAAVMSMVRHSPYRGWSGVATESVPAEEAVA